MANTYGIDNYPPPVATLPGSGKYAFDIVGEASFQEELEEICGEKTEEGYSEIVEAIIIHEDDNPYDEQAVRVDIEGYTVGYFNRESARNYRAQLKNMGYEGMTTKCSAMIVGGWNRGGGDTGKFGVKLDLPIS